MSDTLGFTILGCGSSPGVPRIHGEWGACDPNEPKNRRLRCSLLVERINDIGKTVVVIDTGPDFRQQMLNADVKAIDAVLYTHSHADHLHGIDDLRGYALAQRERIPIYADASTMVRIDEGFGYCIQQPEGSIYPAILEKYDMEVGQPVEIKGEGGSIHALPVLQVHGPIHSLGFRFSTDGKFEQGGLCYSPDVSEIPAETAALLRNLDVWIVDALQYKPHISHMSVSESLEWVMKLTPKRTIFTHMHIPLDYQTLKAELPKHVEPAFDGMALEV